MTIEELQKIDLGEKRVKIAMRCGWAFSPTKERSKRGYLAKGSHSVTVWRDWTFGGERNLPHYRVDLNAMAEARHAVIDDDLKMRREYTRNLRIAIDPNSPQLVTEYRLLNAEASEHADAFLLTTQP